MPQFTISSVIGNNIPIEKLFSLLFSDSSQFLLQFHQKAEHSSIKIQKWKNNQREISFSSNTVSSSFLKKFIPTSGITLKETQEYKFKKDEFILYSQITLNLKVFSNIISTKWIFKLNTQNSIQLIIKVSYEVSSWFKNSIEKTIEENTRKELGLWIELAQKELAKESELQSQLLLNIEKNQNKNQNQTQIQQKNELIQILDQLNSKIDKFNQILYSKQENNQLISFNENSNTNDLISFETFQNFEKAVNFNFEKISKIQQSQKNKINSFSLKNNPKEKEVETRTRNLEIIGIIVVGVLGVYYWKKKK
ncbi:hypothetical protein M0811_07701 [Anaeramoeba ignava]|uniref:VASt domain-containing protein n=1 Tax=Anaeramoeba ignava TaxID=1746090 RepID=A0A9Q0RCC1_ANAIG|nr:hypothetical protein M0811_07701 [Anaeramoeba ignava]